MLEVLTLLLVALHLEPLGPLPTCGDSFPFGLPSPCVFMLSLPFSSASIFVHFSSLREASTQTSMTRSF